MQCVQNPLKYKSFMMNITGKIFIFNNGCKKYLFKIFTASTLT